MVPLLSFIPLACKTAQIDAHKTTQARAVVQRLLASKVGQVEPVLDEVNPQHALQTNGRATIATFRVNGSITVHSSAHGTIVFIVSRNSSRRVRLRRVSNPVP
jgi:hypothetical protein